MIIKVIEVDDIDSFTLRMYLSQAPTVHTYNPSYIEGRDREDHGSKPACS
jgi:hypothetical protein